MRKPNQITVDRALLLYVLHLAEPHGLLSDVKLQQLSYWEIGFREIHLLLPNRERKN